MKQNKEFIAIVLDEYGGVRGLITFTDLVECLVGEFAETDEGEETVETIVALGEDKFEINGSVTISELESALELEIIDCDSDTLNGYVLGIYGSIPEDGTIFEISTDIMDIQVLEFTEHKIEKAIITLKLPSEDEEENEKSKVSKAEIQG